jgi:hypothetical protein
MVDHETFPWCNACEEPHDQDTCLYVGDIIEHAREANKEESSGDDTTNYVGEGMDTINNVTTKAYNVSEDLMK